MITRLIRRQLKRNLSHTDWLSGVRLWQDHFAYWREVKRRAKAIKEIRLQRLWRRPAKNTWYESTASLAARQQASAHAANMAYHQYQNALLNTQQANQINGLLNSPDRLGSHMNGAINQLLGKW